MTISQVFAGKSLATSTQFCLKAGLYLAAAFPRVLVQRRLPNILSLTLTRTPLTPRRKLLLQQKKEEKEKKSQIRWLASIPTSPKFFLLGLWVLFLASGNWSQWSLIAHCCNKQQHLRKVKCPLTKYFNNFYMGRLDLIHMLNL